MSIHTNKLKRLTCHLTLVALLCLTAAGCAKWNLRGDGFPEWQQAAFSNRRPDTPTELPFGVSTKAQQIERSFGIGRGR